MTMTPHVALSLTELLAAGMALGCFVFVYAQAQIQAADVTLLDALQTEGLLTGDPRRDYATLSRLIRTMAPAVAMRSEYWVSYYATLMRIGSLFSSRTWASGQMRLLAAHQAARYRLAANELAALRS